MLYELSDHEWAAIEPMLPNTPRGVRRVNDRRVLSGIFWVLRSGGAMARSARDLWSPYHLLQSVRALAAGGRLGPDHGCAGRRLMRRCRWAASRARGPTSYRSAIATPSASARTCTARNLIERFFNKIEQCRRVATRYDKLASDYLAFVKLASIRVWLRANESAP